MSNPFVAEIRIFAGNFAPRGWAQCNGQLMPISQNTALFSLLGTQYGGDGRSTFGLPDLQGSAPLGQGQGPGLSLYEIGQSGGAPAVTLLQNEMPVHTHALTAATADGTQTAAGGNMLAKGLAGSKQLQYASNIYSTNPTSATIQFSPQSLGIAGGNQPHNNMMPYLGVTFIIALQGVFPPRS